MHKILAIIPLKLIITFSLYGCWVWINALGMSIITTSLFYLASIDDIIRTASVDTVGLFESPFSAYPCCFFWLAQALPLIFLSFFLS